ncbi:hypothetical protein G7084_04085 [Weissella coleopterorum]|uniref:Uncharacterized protein n=1 Tax=Weissella coleopterorum TaxID=2714949 RepID=A0A6G8B0A9_9LACO|nr:hypothetical protein [Weissella coleopterorum]QIL50563.1 hypothetical protein G7084_04085 [Weissella coleopterorum]
MFEFIKDVPEYISDNIIFLAIIFQYFLMFCYHVYIKVPYKRRFTRGVIFLITGIILAIIVKTSLEGNNSIISGIIAIFPLFTVKG